MEDIIDFRKPNELMSAMIVRVDSVVNTTMAHENEQYNISMATNLFHSIPHVNIRLKYLQNKTFDPYDDEYLESLGILVALPGFWLILTLIFFLIFFLCRCCDAANSKRKRKLTFCKLCLFMFALLSICVLTMGMIGNCYTHYGMQRVQNASQDITDVVGQLRRETGFMSAALGAHVDRKVEELNENLKNGLLVKDQTRRNMLDMQLFNAKRNVSRALKIVSQIHDNIPKLRVEDFNSAVKFVEPIRWPTTFALLGSLCFICLILICGIFRHSRCLLILFSVLGLLSLVICWVITSLYLGISVAGSDFCHNPRPFLEMAVENIAVEVKTIHYYLDCYLEDEHPYSKQIREADSQLSWTQTSILEFERLCQKSCKDAQFAADLLLAIKTNLSASIESMQTLVTNEKCERVHEDYTRLMSGLCKYVLEGVALMLISSTAAGVCFTLLVLCASHTWINIRKKRPIVVDQTDETDPFLPPASSTSTTSSANSKRVRDSYGSGSSGRPRYGF